jgi:AAA family ATP:ADP antiporter
VSNLFIDTLKKPIRFILLVFSLLILGFSLFYSSGIENKTVVLLTEVAGWSGIIGTFWEFFWNIRLEEYRKFAPFALMCSSIIFIYTICRQVKDTLLISAIGSEGSTMAKVFVMLFAFIYFKYYYSKLSRKVDYKQYLLVAALPILIYYFVFNFFLMDNCLIVPSAETIVKWKTSVPMLSRVFDLISIWPVTLYYILSEIFAAAVTSTVFWQLANRFCNSDERSRFYPALMIISQIASLITGVITKSLCSAKNSNYSVVVNKITIIVLILGVVLFITNWFLFKYGVSESDLQETKKKEKSEGGFSSLWKENPKYVLVAFLCVFYGFCSVFLEQFWKDKIRIMFIDKISYGRFMGSYIILQSRVALLVSMFISNLFMRYSSWFWFAALTPLLTVVGALILFSPFVFPAVGSIVPGLEPIALVCYAGMWVIGFFKSFKYGSFDPSKEEYIAQQESFKREIKNLEGSLNRVGKCGGSVIMAIIFSMMPGLSYKSTSVAVGLGVATFVFGIAWLFSVLLISRDVKPRTIT